MFSEYILTSFALIFVIEGLLYTLFPDKIRRLMASALALPPEKLRLVGFTMILSGVLLVWLLKNLFHGET